MIKLNDSKVKKFRQHLYHEKVPRLFLKGGKGLKPLSRYKKDENGLTIVSTQEITAFFLNHVEGAGIPYPDQYMESLYTLLEVMSRNAEPISFDCGFSISETDIQNADNKTTIELLTTNIIITYFNHLKTHKGSINLKLLAPGLADLIDRSNAGRDYKTLLSNTLTALVTTLADDKPWRQYLDDINDADLICRLTGTKLPSMDKKTLAGIIEKSRKEIINYDTLLTKILHTRDQLVGLEKNDKKYLKSMEKINEATRAVLLKIDLYLKAAHQLMKIIGLPPDAVLGKSHESLKANIVRLFLGTKPGETGGSNILKNLGVATARYRLSLLFNYPDITRYCRSFSSDDQYKPLYLDLFRLLYSEVTQRLRHLDPLSPDTGIRQLNQNLAETVRAVRHLALDPLDLEPEKNRVRQAFIQLLQGANFMNVGKVVDLGQPLCRATQDQKGDIADRIRSALLEACATSLAQYAQNPLPPDQAKNGIKKRLHAHAVHYKPQREFYQSYFTTYVGASTPSFQMAGLIQNNKSFAIALLMVFSNETDMADLLRTDQILHASDLLSRLREKI